MIADTFYIYTNDGLLIQVNEGTGDSLLPEDFKEGFVDYAVIEYTKADEKLAESIIHGDTDITDYSFDGIISMLTFYYQDFADEYAAAEYFLNAWFRRPGKVWTREMYRLYF